MVTVPAFGLVRYTLQHSKSNSHHSISAVVLYNSLPYHYAKGYVPVTEWLFLSSHAFEFKTVPSHAEVIEIATENYVS